ncbi:MAG TPA: PHB depolymerase family esterase [Chthoniobacterales bacterium]|nr:PHB depolymerase family esterase [Chthoniobacterales bacterium]
MKLISKLLVVTIGIILLSRFAIAQNAPPPPGDSIQTMEVNGVKRIYRLHIPQGYDGSKPLPLVFALHGRGGNGMGMEQGTGWGKKADEEHFVAVFPNAMGQPQTWNSGLNPELSGNADDVGFIRELLDKLESTLNIDKRRIYSCGMSSGAIMTGRLGGELSDRFAALGIAAGTVGAKQADGSERQIPKPAKPIPVIAFHGKKDGTVFFNGGGPLANCFSVARSRAFWIKADGCSGEPRRSTQQSGNLTIEDYNQCSGGTEVVYYIFANGGHVWPSLQNDDHLSATDAMWDFFVKHPKP